MQYKIYKYFFFYKLKKIFLELNEIKYKRRNIAHLYFDFENI